MSAESDESKAERLASRQWSQGEHSIGGKRCCSFYRGPHGDAVLAHRENVYSEDDLDIHNGSYHEHYHTVKREDIPALVVYLCEVYLWGSEPEGDTQQPHHPG